jgi:hypothetical protein
MQLYLAHHERHRIAEGGYCWLCERTDIEDGLLISARVAPRFARSVGPIWRGSRPGSLDRPNLSNAQRADRACHDRGGSASGALRETATPAEAAGPFPTASDSPLPRLVQGDPLASARVDEEPN